MDKTQDDLVRALLRRRLQGDGAPELKLPDPPELPPDLPPTTTPRVHHVVAWRHDGRLDKTAHASKAAAFAFARALSWALIWKWAVMDGRDMIARELVNPPADMNRADVALVIGG